MDARRQDLKKLTKEGYVDINPELVSELSHVAVQRLLDEFAEKEEQQEGYVATLTSGGAIAEAFGVRGATQLTIDIAKNRPILGNIASACSMISTKKKYIVLLAGVGGIVGYCAYKYYPEINNDGDNNNNEEPKKTKRKEG